MKINCRHGFFVFDEVSPGDASRFYSRYNMELVPFRDQFTFKALENPAEFCISGQQYMGADVATTFAGEPWEIFEANGLVYSFVSGLVVPKASILGHFEISQVGNYFVSNGLIQPGSIKADGSKIISYSAYFSFDTLKFRYSGVEYD